MKNELQRHTASDKIKWVITCIAFVLIFVILTGLCLQIFGRGKVKPSEWFTHTETAEAESKEPAASVKYVDLQINAYDVDENNAVLETTHVLTPDENNVVTFTYKDYTLSVPTIEGVAADKYEITYFKAANDSDEYEEITETEYLRSGAGNFKFTVEFNDPAYKRVEENPVTVTINKKKVDFNFGS